MKKTINNIERGSFMKLTKGASEATRKYMVDGIRYVCENFKERAPGTGSERKAQKYLAGELEKWSDKVEMEDFDLHPGAFMGWIPVAGVIGIISVIFFWLTYKNVVSGSILAIIATVFVLLALACLVIEF